jgi:hypothetical protein
MMMRIVASNLYSTDGRNVEEDGKSRETSTNVLLKNPKDTLAMTAISGNTVANTVGVFGEVWTTCVPDICSALNACVPSQ